MSLTVQGVAVAAKKHVGFDKASSQVARKQGVSAKRADAIIAAGARNASAKAKRANPRLRRVTRGGK